MEELKSLKELITSKFEVVKEPKKDDFVIVIREELIYEETGEKNFEIGIGKTMKFANKYSINGMIYRNEELDEIKDGTMQVAVKELNSQDDRHSIIVVKTPKAFKLAFTEAMLGNRLKTLDDVVDIIKNFDPTREKFTIF
ncbi:MAG: hypothetical protein ACTSVI_11575 [Promethearchaeota archaeon]